MALFSNNFYDDIGKLVASVNRSRYQRDADKTAKELTKATNKRNELSNRLKELDKQIEETKKRITPSTSDNPVDAQMRSKIDANLRALQAERNKVANQLAKAESNLTNATDKAQQAKQENTAYQSKENPAAEYSAGMKKAGDFTKNAFNKRVKFTPDMYGALTNMMNINSAAKQAEALREQANLHDIQAGTEQQYAQKWGQIENDDYRRRAEQDAVAGATQQNTQKIGQAGNVTGSNAYLMKDTGKADYNTHLQRQDTARQKAIEGYREMYGTQQVATQERAGAEKATDMARTDALYNTESRNLAMAKAKQDAANKNMNITIKQEQPEQPATTEDENPATTDEQPVTPETPTTPETSADNQIPETPAGSQTPSVENKPKTVRNETTQQKQNTTPVEDSMLDENDTSVTPPDNLIDTSVHSSVYKNVNVPKGYIEIRSLVDMYNYLNANKPPYYVIYTGPDPVSMDNISDPNSLTQTSFNENAGKGEYLSTAWEGGTESTKPLDFSTFKYINSWKKAARPIVESKRFK